MNIRNHMLYLVHEYQINMRDHMLHSVHRYQMNMRSHMLHSVSIWNEYHAVCFNLQYCFLSDRLIETFKNSVLLIVSSLQK